jgi:hypothetical protein
VTLDACRRGGVTELGDAGATEFAGMAASMHRPPSTAALRQTVPGPACKRSSKTPESHRTATGERKPAQVSEQISR